MSIKILPVLIDFFNQIIHISFSTSRKRICFVYFYTSALIWYWTRFEHQFIKSVHCKYLFFSILYHWKLICLVWGPLVWQNNYLNASPGALGTSAIISPMLLILLITKFIIWFMSIKSENAWLTSKSIQWCLQSFCLINSPKPKVIQI